MGVKVAAALAAAHGQAGQAVLEHLLEAQELDDGQVDAGMEAQAALVGADGRVELDAVAAVHLDLAVVVHPGHAEHDHALRLNDALDQAVLFQLGAGLDDRLQAFQNFVHRLQKLFLLGVALGQTFVHTGQISVLDRHSNTLSLFWRHAIPIRGTAPRSISLRQFLCYHRMARRARENRKKCPCFLFRMCLCGEQTTSDFQKTYGIL